jgi:hypothetical protein
MAYVQGNQHQNGGASSTTVAVTLGAAVTSGNALMVSVGWGSSSGADTVTGVTDDKGNTYQLVDQVRDATQQYLWRTAYLLNVTNGPITITATINNTNTFGAILVDEYSGVATSAALDGHAMQGQVSPATTADAVKSGAITTTANGNLIYGTTVEITGLGTITHGTGFTARINVAGVFMTEDEVQATAGLIANGATFTASNAADSWITGVMAFKAAATDTLMGQACL